ncbi:MAG: MerR family transcriptional regulator [Chloroflexi bacterium]|nr:MerR family transcriptional regulator [Chloroflexota bacterium]
MKREAGKSGRTELDPGRAIAYGEAEGRPVRLEVRQGPAPDPEGVYGGVFVMSVASRLLEMHPQTLRKYERLGLIRPSRTLGMRRLYSEDEIVRLRLIKHLVEEMRLNLAGVEFTLTLLSRLQEMRSRLRTMADADDPFEAMQREMNAVFKLLLQGE